LELLGAEKAAIWDPYSLVLDVNNAPDTWHELLADSIKKS